MTWNKNSTISRKNEVLYHKLSSSDKLGYLAHKYFTPENWANLYLAYTPNIKEFSNNAFWRLNSDIFLDHLYKGVTDPFTKEPAYAVFNLFPMVTASTLKLPIGESNNTYTFAHLAYTGLRAAGKFAPMIIHYDKKDIPGALDSHVKTSIYLTDIICRWIPYSDERLQSDNSTDIYSFGFFAASIISGMTRTKGSELGNAPAKFAQELTTNIINNVVINPLGINVEGTTFLKINELKDILIGGTAQQSNIESNFKTTNSQAKTLATYAAPLLTIGYQVITYSAEKASYFAPLFNVPYEYASVIISTSISPLVFVYSKTTEASQTAISYVASPLIKMTTPYVPKVFSKSTDNTPVTLEQASQKGAIFLAGAITLDIFKFLATNLVGTMILVPCSRIVGIFSEEVTEFVSDLTNILMGPAEHAPLDYSTQGYEDFSGKLASDENAGSEF